MNDGVLKISSMKDRCSPHEWQARVDLAACYRLVDLYGMSDMMANHISMRVPDEETFLINPYGMMYEEITASCLIKVGLAGNVLAKPDFGELNYGINMAGYVIHSAVHEARRDVACVIHNHSWASMAVSALDCGLLPITQTAMRFLKIGYHEYEGVVLNDAEKESLVRDLGKGEALILRNHGALVVGRTVGEAFNWTHRLELACRSQVAAMSCNTKLREVPQAVLEALRDARLHVRAEREARERDRQGGTVVRTGVGERPERVLGLADALVERAVRRADTAEVEPHRHVVEREERLGERLRDLVVERAALQRVRMRDERDAAPGCRRRVADDLERPRGAVDHGPLGDARETGEALRQMTSLSTISPFTTCRSTISSMSARST